MLFVVFPFLLLISSLSLIFVILINMCLSFWLTCVWCVPPHILYETLFASWTAVNVFLLMLGTFFSYYLFKYSSSPFSFLTPSGSTRGTVQMLVHLMLFQMSLRLSSFLFIFLCFFYSATVISISLSSSSLIHFSASFILILIPSSVFFISIIAFFICLFCKTSGFLLNISCIFFICDPILFLRSWIIFTFILWVIFLADCLYPLLLIFLMEFYLVVFLWDKFLCHLILSNFLCL